MFDIFVQYWWQFCLVAVLSYLVGSINFAVIFSRMIKKTDVRTCGSGNPGTTNMYRVFGLSMGILTLVCDVLKGVVCCLAARFALMSLGAEAMLQAQYFAGLFAVLGHVFPAFYRLRGGKGVATAIGVVTCVQPILMLYCLVPMILIILFTDRMSVMSLMFSLFMIVWSWLILLPTIGALCCILLTVMFALVIFAHRHNIIRLCTGKENSMGIRRALRGKGGHYFDKHDEHEEKPSSVVNTDDDNLRSDE